jgi:hypothetical protein
MFAPSTALSSQAFDILTKDAEEYLGGSSIFLGKGSPGQ